MLSRRLVLHARTVDQRTPLRSRAEVIVYPRPSALLVLLSIVSLSLSGCGRDAADRADAVVAAMPRDAGLQAAPAHGSPGELCTATPTAEALETPQPSYLRVPDPALATPTPDPTSVALRDARATEAVAAATGAVVHSSDIAFPGFGLAEYASEPDVIVSGTLGVEVREWRWDMEPRVQDMDALLSLPGPSPSWPWVWRSLEVHDVFKGEARVHAGEHLLLRYSDPRIVDNVAVDGLEAGVPYVIALYAQAPLAGHADPSFRPYHGHHGVLRVTADRVRYADPDRHRTEFALDLDGAAFLAMLRDELARQAIATPTPRSAP